MYDVVRSNGVRLQIATDSLDRVEKDDEFLSDTRMFAYQMYEAFNKSLVRTHKDFNKDRQANSERLLAALRASGLVFGKVTTIPNEYSGDAHYLKLPWLVVQTLLGPIKVGWRKRVIVLDYSGCDLPAAIELWPEEDVTKDGQMIHCWGYDKLKEYASKIAEYQQRYIPQTGELQ